jgi:hypothetical protein
MPRSASQLWKELAPDTRAAAAGALWRDAEAFEQQAEATALLARRLKFRTKSVQALPIERRARFLAQVQDVSDAVAGRALIAYHFETARPLMSAFLDALEIPHEDGLITAEDVPPPDQVRLADGVERIRAAFPVESVDLYLRTLVALDADTWTGLDTLLQVSR